MSELNDMTDQVTLSEKQKQLIERVGVQHEKAGFSPAAARVVALLLVSPVPELSFDQIRETLGLSKSATSNALNFLINTDKIDYITYTGDRKRYFKSKISSWRESMKDAIIKITGTAALMEEILEQRPDSTPEFNKSLSEVIDFMRYINQELPALYEKWEKRNS